MLALIIVFSSAFITKTFDVPYESIETVILYTVIIVMFIGIIVEFIEKKRGRK